MKIKISELLDILNKNNITYNFHGNSNTEVEGYSSLYNYKPGTLTWARYSKDVGEIPYRCIITDSKTEEKNCFEFHIVTDDPRHAFFCIIESVWGEKSVPSVASDAIIEDGAILGKNVSIGHFTYISSGVEIGDGCNIGNNVSIKNRVKIGYNTIIQSGAIIGESGFAHIKDDDKLINVPHYGGVSIGHDVSVGSCTCICRGTIDDTEIGDYVKIDNLCHIAHNVRLGDRVQIIAGSVVMGSVKVGHDTWVATSVIRDQRTIGDNAVVGMGAVVVKNVESGITVAGNPAKPFERKETI